MEQFTISNLYNLEETIAAELFEGAVYPWELLPKISGFIVTLGEKLPADKYTQVKEQVWIANSASILLLFRVASTDLSYRSIILQLYLFAPSDR